MYIYIYILNSTFLVNRVFLTPKRHLWLSNFLKESLYQDCQMPWDVNAPTPLGAGRFFFAPAGRVWCGSSCGYWTQLPKGRGKTEFEVTKRWVL